MRRAARWWGGLAATVSALVFATPASAAPEGFFGILPNEVPTAADFRKMSSGGVETFRFQLRWENLEPSPPDGVGSARQHFYNWRTHDRQIADAARALIRPLPYFYTTPRWMNADPRDQTLDTTQERADFQAFVRAAVRRYGPDGLFWRKHPRLPELPPEIWQISNEQNSSKFFQPAPSPERYAELVRLGHDAVKSVDPSARVALGGMFGTPFSENAVRAWKYLRQLYEVPGISSSFDLVAVHPYSPNIRGQKIQIRKMRRVMSGNGDRRKRLYITEMGWSSDRGRAQQMVGRRGQAQRLRRSFRTLLANRRKWRLEGIVWFTFRDADVPEPDCKWCGTTGLFDVDRKAKPAWRQFKRIGTG